MTHEKAVSHWRKRAQAELKTARILLEKQDADVYGEVLFHCHLALELALKATYLHKHDEAAPFTHDLNELANLVQRTISKEEREAFEQITEFAILSRYGDEEWYDKHATKENATLWTQKTEKLLSRFLQS